MRDTVTARDKSLSEIGHPNVTDVTTLLEGVAFVTVTQPKPKRP